MNLAIDTNAYSDFCKGEEKSVSVVRSAHRIMMPFIVLAELRAGFLSGIKIARERVRSYEISKLLSGRSSLSR